MKNKSIFRTFAIVLFIVSCVLLFLVLEGSFGKIQIKRVVDNYFSALSEGRYESAKTYCVPERSRYKFIEFVKKQREEIPLYNPTFTTCITKWNWVNSMEAFIDIELVMTVPTLFGVNMTETIEDSIFLIKEKGGLFGTWKLK